MKIGTKSVLFGAHAFWLHPVFVAEAWRRLYGFPFDPRLWFAFLVHDLGYWGKPNMDGPEGETHPELGARIMGWLFDFPRVAPTAVTHADGDFVSRIWNVRWYEFTLLHSRHYAKKVGLSHSRLCVADKLACALTPAWLYVPMVCATGEIEEYMANGRARSQAAGLPGPKGDALRRIRTGALTGDPWLWFEGLQRYMLLWVAEHKEGQEDNWTSKRHAA